MSHFLPVGFNQENYLIGQSKLSAPSQQEGGGNSGGTTSQSQQFSWRKGENTLVSIIEMFIGLNPKENEHASFCHYHHSRGHDVATGSYGVWPVEGQL